MNYSTHPSSGIQPLKPIGFKQPTQSNLLAAKKGAYWIPDNNKDFSDQPAFQRGEIAFNSNDGDRKNLSDFKKDADQNKETVHNGELVSVGQYQVLRNLTSSEAKKGSNTHENLDTKDLNSTSVESNPRNNPSVFLKETPVDYSTSNIQKISPSESSLSKKTFTSQENSATTKSFKMKSAPKTNLLPESVDKKSFKVNDSNSSEKNVLSASLYPLVKRNPNSIQNLSKMGSIASSSISSSNYSVVPSLSNIQSDRSLKDKGLESRKNNVLSNLEIQPKTGLSNLDPSIDSMNHGFKLLKGLNQDDKFSKPTDLEPSKTKPEVVLSAINPYSSESVGQNQQSADKHSTSSLSYETSQKILRQMERFRSSNQDTFRFTLNVPEGSITVRLKMIGKKIEAHFISDSPGFSKQLDAGWKNILNTAKQNGIELAYPIIDIK